MYLLLAVIAACGLGSDPSDGTLPGKPECVAELEVAYDGVDQDCDGSDLVDVDGDEFAAYVAGGDDCDDADTAVNPGASEVCNAVDDDCDGLVDADDPGVAGAYVVFDDADGDDYGDSSSAHPSCEAAGPGTAAVGGDCDDADRDAWPGATETPYDGVDQDCDGADLVDVDGDGHAGTAAGGGDCDDQDADVHPEQGDHRGDAVDNDCDGMTDEYVVCAEGVADFRGLEEAAATVEAGATLALCPGVYDQYLVVWDSLKVVGMGEDPSDVVLTQPDLTNYVIWVEGSEGETDFEVRNLSFNHPRGLMLNNFGDLVVDHVEFCPDVDMERGVSGVEGGNATVTHSRFCTKNDDYSLAYPIDVYPAVSLTIRGNLFEGAGNPLDGSGDFAYLALEGQSCLVENNIFLGGGTMLGDNGLFGDDAQPTTVVRHNVFIESITLIVESFGSGSYPGSDQRYYNNVFYDVGVMGDYNSNGRVYGLYDFDWYGYTMVDCDGAEPAVWRNTILWNVEEPLLTLESSTYDRDYAHEDCTSESNIHDWSTFEDPLFEWADGPGSYALAPGSPGIDAGYGDPDVDGSPADLGAFGGPHGDWYLEVTWLP